MDMQFIRKIPSPEEIIREYPAGEEVRIIKERRDREIKAIFEGKDDRFLLIIGPCSADREDAVLDYMHRLRELEKEVADKLFFIPRVYTNKPRTIGRGYKGMLHQPDPTGEEDMLNGLISIRKMHIDVVRQTGFTCAEEMLYPENHMYLADLLSYVAVGARSVEDQLHRHVASGIGIPAGMKNPTGGDLTVMLNSIVAAQSPQKFSYRGYEVKTNGNPLAHAILRGYVDRFGRDHPNYHYEDIRILQKEYENRGLKNPACIIDTNHSNSGKDYLEQIRIAKDVCHSRHVSGEIRRFVKGLMIESYLEDGCQDVSGSVYGKSITDPCLGFEKTKKLVLDIAKEV